jgi:hypothetical protein
MTQHRIFYSWESDHPNPTNRSFIEKALEEAVREISTDSLAIEPVIDRDTLGLPGAPDIVHSIFEKIEQAAIFVCDVSIVSPSTANRSTPNPNVLIELGYALKALGHERVLLVMNTAYGEIKKLPFDLDHRRVLTYEVREDLKDKAAKRRELSKKLTTGLKSILAHHLQTLGEQELYPGPTVARAWFDTVINPLLSKLAGECMYLERGKWTWVRYGDSLVELSRIKSFADENLALNLEQIIESHSQLKTLIAKHDEEVVMFHSQVETLFCEIRESAELRRIYSEITSFQALILLKAGGFQSLSYCNTEEEILNRLFGHSANEAEGLTWLAQEIVNESGKLPDHIGHAPIWNSNRERLLTLLNQESFKIPIQDVRGARNILMQTINELWEELKKFRKELAMKFQIPFVSSDNIRPFTGSRMSIPIA